MARRSVAAAPISNRNALALLKTWGFTEVGGNGGHVVLALNGHNVQLTAVGRKTPTPWKALRKAAAIVGVPIQDLMRGPKKEKVMSASEAKIAEPLAVVETGTTAVAVAEPEPEANPAPIQSAVFKCPDEECGKEFDNLKSVRVHQRSHNMVKCRNCNKTMSEPSRAPHEKWCVLRKPDGKLAQKLAADAVTEPEPKPTTKPRGRPKGTTKTVMAERRQRMAKAVETDAREVLAARTGRSIDDETLDTLIGLMFPQGFPANLGALRALTEWVDATEHLLTKTGSS